MPVAANTDGSVTVTYSLGDAGGGSGVSRARVVAVQEAAAGARDQRTGVLEAATAGDKSVVASSDLAGSVGSGRVYTFGAGALNHYARYFFYAACQDAQGWYDAPPGSAVALHTPGAAAGVPIGGNGGRTYDPTPPSIAVTGVVAQTDGTLRVTYSLSESGGSGLDGARIAASTTAMTRAAVLAASGSSAANVSRAGTTVNVSGQVVSLSGLANWTAFRVYCAAKDNQGWFDNGSFSGGNASSRAIDNNGGRTWDTVSPSLDASPGMALVSGSSVRIRWSGATDAMSGIDFVKLLATTSPSALANTVIAAAGDSGTAQRVTTVDPAAASGNAVVAGLLTGATVYGWAVSVDNQGNVSAARRTSPTAITLDSQAPTVAWVSGSQTSDTTASITVSVTDDLTGVAAGSVYVRRAGTAVNDYTSAFSGAGNKTFAVTGLQSFTSYNVIATATDGAGNTMGETTVKTFRSWDLTKPTITSVSVSYTGTRADINYSVGDSGSGLRSIAATGDVSGSRALSGTSASGVFSANTLSYGANDNIVVTVTDLAASDASYLTSRGSNNSESVTRSVTVPYPAPTFASHSVTGDAGGAGSTGRVNFSYSVSALAGNLSSISFFVSGTLRQTAALSGASRSGSYTYNLNAQTGTVSNNYMVVSTSSPNSGTATTPAQIVTIQYAPKVNSFQLASPSPETLRFTWNVSDANSNLASVRFYVNGALQSAQNQAISGGSSVSSKDISVAAGTYSGYIVVYDSNNLTAQSATASGVTVVPANFAPTFALGAVTNVLETSADVSWTASDSDGTVQTVVIAAFTPQATSKTLADVDAAAIKATVSAGGAGSGSASILQLSEGMRYSLFGYAMDEDGGKSAVSGPTKGST
eukprot:jgi/Tetstr1/454260/TSEL_041179.t1